MIDELEPVQIPHSPAAERSVIGCLMVDPAQAKTLDLSDADFYLDPMRTIYQVIQELAATGRAIDLTTVCTRLDERKQLAEVGGPAAIMKLMGDTVSILGLESYAATVRERAIRRRALEVYRKGTMAAFDLSQPLDTGAIIDQLVRIGRPTEGAEPISVAAMMVYDDVEKRCENPRDIYGISTGFRDLDQMTDGLQKKSLYVVSGVEGTGKSLFCIQMGAFMARHGHPGAIYELEMPKEQLARRDISANSAIQTDKMLRGKLEDEDWTKFTYAVEDLAGLPIQISDRTDWTTLGIRADAARIKAIYGLDWLIVDYLFLLNDKPGSDDIERTNYIARALKAIAKDLDVIVIAIHSLTKEGKLRGSGEVAYAADDIWNLEKDEQNPTIRWLKPSKARERDQLAKVKLIKVPGLPKFADAAKERP